MSIIKQLLITHCSLLITPLHSSFDNGGRVSGQDGAGFGVGAVEGASGGDGDAVGKGCAFGNQTVTTEPHVVANADFAVGIGNLAVAVDKAVLVGVHKSAVPRSEEVVAESHGLVAYYQRLGTEVEVVAHCEDGVLGHLHRTARAEGALAKDVENATDIQNGAMVTEIGTLAGAETDFHQTHPRLFGMKDEFARNILNHSTIRNKYGHTYGLSERQQTQVVPQTAWQGEEKPPSRKPFFAMTLVHC